MIKISEDTQQVVEYVNQYSGNTLRKKNDFALVLEIGATKNLPEEVLNLVFQGKIIWTLSSKIKLSQPNQDGIELVQKEFETAIEKFKERIGILSSFGDDEIKERIEATYLQLTRGCVLNIIDLSYDLAQFKNMQIESKGR